MTHTCPWWLNPVFDNPVRRLLQHPERTLEPVVSEGSVVADVGCGMGFLALAAARMVGPGGRVHAVDLQQRSLEALARRATKAGLQDRIALHRQDVTALDLPERMDGAWAMWMLHEIGDPSRAAVRLAAALRSGAPLLVAEPHIHVSRRVFDRIVGTLRDAGFDAPRPVRVGGSRAALLRAP